MPDYTQTDQTRSPETEAPEAGAPEPRAAEAGAPDAQARENGDRAVGVAPVPDEVVAPEDAPVPSAAYESAGAKVAADNDTDNHTDHEQRAYGGVSHPDDIHGDPAAEEPARDEAAQDERAGDEAAHHEPAYDEPARDDAADHEPAHEELMPGDVPEEPVGGMFDQSVADGFRDRWQRVQMHFVDDPGDAADQARTLVDDLFVALHEALDRQRQSLANWHSGQAAPSGQAGDTEELRVAVRRYRDLVDRMLSL
jgi:hypothetical protein